MTAPDLSALDALLAKATPRPWHALGEPMKIMAGAPDKILKDELEYYVVGGCGCCGSPFGNEEFAEHDRALIVAAVNALPALIARVRELERERDAAALAMRERCAQACKHNASLYPNGGTGWESSIECAAAIRALEP